MATVVSWNVTVARPWSEINSTNQTGNASLGPTLESASNASFTIHLIVLPILLGPIIVLGITGNSIALWHIIRKKISSPTDILLLNLTIVNILTILASTIAILEITGAYISVESLKYVSDIVTLTNLYGNPPFMTCIAIDQYIAVVHPIRSLAWRKPHYYVVLSIATWLVVLALSLMFVLLTDASINGLVSCEALVSKWKANLVLLLCSKLFTFFIPTLILLTCYALTAKKLIQVGAGKESMELMKKKALRTIWAILALLLFCFAPFHITEVSFILKNLLNSSGEITRWYICHIWYYTWTLTVLSNVLNPLLYIFRSQNFQCRPYCCCVYCFTNM